MIKNEKSKYAKLLAKPIAFHRVYATIGGSACSGLFLSQAVFWSERTKNSEGWFYKTYAEWEQETALNRTELDKVRHHLNAMGIVETQLRGTPAKLHYRINYEIFDKYLDSVINGTFIPSRPKNPNRKKFAEGQQTTVCGGSTNLQFAEGEQTRLHNASKQDCKEATNKFAECEQTILYTENTTENTPYIPPLAEPTPEPHPKKEEEEEESAIPDDIADRFAQDWEVMKEIHSTVNNQDSPTHAENVLLGQKNEAALFDKTEQANKLNNEEAIKAEKIERYRERYEEAGTLPHFELREWAIAELGDLVKLYRKSQRWGSTKVNDIYPSFAEYISEVDSKTGEKKDITYGFSRIKNLEVRPREWSVLGEYVKNWQIKEQQKQHSKLPALPLETPLPPQPVAEISEEEKERSRQLVSERIAAAKQKAQSDKKAPVIKVDQEKQERLAEIETKFNLGI